MQKSFTTQPKLFVSANDLNHPILRSLDDTKAPLKWSEIEKLLSSIYAYNTGRPSYPLLTLFRALLLGTWMYSWLSACVEIFCSVNFVTLNLVEQFLKPPPWDAFEHDLSNIVCGINYWQRLIVSLKPKTS
ncbi:MAG: hypothetical protein QS721_09135 [Candidatus Endonucleobacter sp. (ex Gigantidas childressi)]|nr:hypothetical protein [Candidatus Endonucleobacter sp. (ex Gigantidas childressi)]